MAQLHRLEDYRRKRRREGKATYFDRHELNQLLSLYSRRVMSGEWRDYAIDHAAGLAFFSIFRHSHEQPLYSIAKRQLAPGTFEYLLFAGRQKVRSSPSLADLIARLDKRLSVIS